MKLNSKEKLIWAQSKEIKIPILPKKDLVWNRLSQKIDILQNQKYKPKPTERELQKDY